MVLVAHLHCVDGKLRLVVTNDRDDLKQFAVPSRPEAQTGVVVLIVDRHRILRCMPDVLVSDAVLSRRRMNLHLDIVVRNPGIDEVDAQAPRSGARCV